MYKIYKIEPDDNSIEKIASKFNTTKDVLYKLNGTSNIIIEEGTLIIVPENDGNVFEVYTVKKGDTAFSIASDFNISVENLLSLNGLNVNDYIYANQQILVPKENIDIYITKPGDTIFTVSSILNTTSENLVKENKTIYLIPDQLMYFKNEI